MISEQFSKFDSEAIDRLLSLPTLFAYEQFRDAPARFGWLSDIRTRREEVRVTYRLDSRVAPIPASELGARHRHSEMNRTHWAIKDEDLIGVLADAGLLDKGKIARTEGAAANVATSSGLAPFSSRRRSSGGLRESQNWTSRLS